MIRRTLTLLPLAFLVATQLSAATLNVPPSAFMDDEIDRTQTSPFGAFPYTYSGIADGNLRAGISAWPVCADAPVLLPHGAVIHQLTLWAVDADPMEDLLVQLMRKPIGTSTAPSLVADVTSVGNSSAVQIQAEIISHTFDRLGHVYFLRACFAGPQLHNVVLDYDGPPIGALSRSPITLHPAAFRETSGRNEAMYRLNDGYVRALWGQDEYLTAPLELPAGSVIERLGATLSNPDGNPFSIQLRRKRLNNAVVSEVLAEVTSIPSDGSIQTPSDTTITQPVVDDAYEYFLLAHDMEGVDGQHIYDVTVEHGDLIFADGFETGDASRWDTGTPVEHKKVITAAAFRAYVSAYDTGNPPTDVVSTFEWGKGMFRLSPADPDIPEGFCAITPVIVPNGARLTSWIVWGFDADLSLDMTVELRRKRAIQVTGTSIVSSITSLSSAGAFSRAELLDFTVDNEDQHLYVSWCQHEDADIGDFALMGIELFYETSS